MAMLGANSKNSQGVASLRIMRPALFKVDQCHTWPHGANWMDRLRRVIKLIYHPRPLARLIELWQFEPWWFSKKSHRDG
jgi:hypothetical protein